mmetsp:Transcript_15350/g.30814  ORF Transcript_15350/g.30814 Transcript_15350/m.30814 type:complete len:216 (+) Transcript_15350:295-942(+)
MRRVGKRRPCPPLQENKPRQAGGAPLPWGRLDLWTLLLLAAARLRRWRAHPWVSEQLGIRHVLNLALLFARLLARRGAVATAAIDPLDRSEHLRRKLGELCACRLHNVCDAAWCDRAHWSRPRGQLGVGVCEREAHVGHPCVVWHPCVVEFDGHRAERLCDLGVALHCERRPHNAIIVKRLAVVRHVVIVHHPHQRLLLLERQLGANPFVTPSIL